jgi:hypothetical protein
LMLELPNFDSPFATLFGQHWFPLEVPRHLYHFTAWTLQGMLAKAGLHVSAHTGVRGVLSPETLAWSLGAIWRSWRKQPHDDALTLNPALLLLALPAAWLVARRGRSDHLAVVATRPHRVVDRM